MKKVIVIGCPGSGKSTFSRALHRVTGLPLFHLDLLNWNPDRTTVPRPVFLERQREILAEDAWILDGNYGSTMNLRMQFCDTVFFLDYPPDVCLEGIASRKGRERPDMPWTEPSEDDEEFLGFVRNFARDSRPAILELLCRYPDKTVYSFRDREQADGFLRTFEKK